MSSCVELLPAPPCGYHGQCVSVDNTSFTCVCDSGWSQSLELGVYFVDQSELNTDICWLNEKLLKFLYYFALGVAGVTVIIQLLQVRRRKQLKRLLPVLCGLGLSIIVSLYKLNSFNDALFGVDVAFTFLVSNAILFDLISVIIFFQKYLKYLASRVKLSSQKLISRTKLFQKLAPYVVIFDIVNYQLFWISALLQRPAAYALIRLAFGLTFIRTTYTLFMAMTVLNQFISDMKMLISFTKQTPTFGKDQNIGTPKESFDDVEEGSFVNSSVVSSVVVNTTNPLHLKPQNNLNLDNLPYNHSVTRNQLSLARSQAPSIKIDDTTRWIKKQLPKTIRMKWTIFVFGLLWYIYGFLPAVFPHWLHLYGYVIPTIFSTWAVVNFSAISAHKKATNSLTKTKTKTGEKNSKKTTSRNPQSASHSGTNTGLNRDPSFSFYSSQKNLKQVTSDKMPKLKEELKGMQNKKSESNFESMTKDTSTFDNVKKHNNNKNNNDISV